MTTLPSGFSLCLCVSVVDLVWRISPQRTQGAQSSEKAGRTDGLVFVLPAIFVVKLFGRSIGLAAGGWLRRQTAGRNVQDRPNAV